MYCPTREPRPLSFMHAYIKYIARMFIVYLQILYCCRHYHLHWQDPVVLSHALPACPCPCPCPCQCNWNRKNNQNWDKCSTALLKHCLQLAMLFMHMAIIIYTMSHARSHKILTHFLPFYHFHSNAVHPVPFSYSRFRPCSFQVSAPAVGHQLHRQVTPVYANQAGAS